MKLPPSTSTISTRGSQISYENVQFTKAPTVLRGMGLAHLSKNEKAIKELTGKGMAPG
jgi:lactoylglutathione lyase